MVFSIFYQSKCCISNAHCVRLPCETQNLNWFRIWGSHSSENHVFCLLWWDNVCYVRWYHWSWGTAVTIVRVLASALKLEKTMILKFIWYGYCILWVWAICINGDSGFFNASVYTSLKHCSFIRYVNSGTCNNWVIYHHSLYTHHVLPTCTVILFFFILSIPLS
jgi:hypothetical protein